MESSHSKKDIDEKLEKAIWDQIEKEAYEGGRVNSNEDAYSQKKATVDSLIDELEKEWVENFTAGFDLINEVIDQVASPKEIEKMRGEIAQCIGKVSLDELSFNPDGKCIQEQIGLSDETLFQLYRCGAVLFEQNRAEDAMFVFDILVFFNPFIGLYWYALGIAQHQLELFEMALQSYAQAIVLNSYSIEARFNSAKAYLAINEPEEAEQELNEMKKQVKSEGMQEQWETPIEELLSKCR